MRMRDAERYGNDGCQSDATRDRCRRHSDRQFGQSEIGLNLQKTNAVRDFRSTVFWLLGILLNLCLILDTYGTTWMPSRRWRATAVRRWTWRHSARLIPNGGSLFSRRKS